MSKKFLAGLLTVCMMLSLVVIPAAAADVGTLEVGAASADPGQTVTLDLKLTGNQGVKSLGVHVYYKADLLTCDKFEGSEEFRWDPVANPDDPQVSQARKDAGWKMATFGAARAAGVTNDGVLATLTFTVKADAENTTTPLEIEYDACTDINDNSNATLAIKNGSVTITNALPTIDTVALDKSSVEVNGTAGGTVKATATSAKGTDITGMVTWTVTPAGKGVTVGNGPASSAGIATGTVVVDPKAEAGDYTIWAAARLGYTLGESKSATLTVTRAAKAVTTVKIDATPAATIAKPVSGNPKEVTYTAKVSDQYGDAMTGETITWTTEGTLPDKVTVDGAKVTVPSDADTGSFTLKATCSGKSDSITVKVVDIEFTGVDAAITATGAVYGKTWGDIVKVDPSKLTAKVGETTVTGTYTVVDADQYPAAGEGQYSVTFTSTDNTYKNIPVVTDKTVTVAPKAITVTAEDKTRPYGQATNPELTWKVNTADLVGTDTKAVLTVNLTCAATATSPVGTVDITGTGTADNYTVTVAKGTLTITPVKVTAIATVPTALNLSKAQVTAADATLVKLGLPEKVTLSFSDNVADAQVNATFDKTLADIQAVANTVTDAADKTVEVTLTNACFPAYADKAGSTVTMPKATITITNKYPIPAEDITMDDATVTFGATYEDPAATVADKPEYAGVTKTYAYTDAAGKAVAGKPVNAGEYTVTVTVENASYKGSQTAKLTIEPKTISGATVTLPKDFAATYTGKAHTPAVTVADGETALVADKDYTVAYAKNINAGTATVTVTGKGNYKETATQTFEIAKASLAEMTPTIIGNAKVGEVLTAKLKDVVGGDDTQFLWDWYIREGDEDELITGGETDGYTVPFMQIFDDFSGLTLVVKARAQETGNYTGESKLSAPVTVAKIAVAGTLVIEKDGQGAIAVGDTLDVSLVNARPAYLMEDGVFETLDMKWTPADADPDTEGYQVPAGATTITLTLTPDQNYVTGTLTATVEVGKTVLAGTITLTDNEGVLEAAVDLGEATADDYQLVWLRDGVAFKNPGEDQTKYEYQSADRGHDISVKAVAKGSAYTGELVSENVMTILPEAPEAPVATATAGDGKVTVSWKAPADNGAPILAYVVTVTDAEGTAQLIQLVSTTLTYTVEDLTNDAEYTFTVSATNAAGTTVSEAVKATPKAGAGYVGGGGSVVVNTNTKTETLADGTKATTTTTNDGTRQVRYERTNGDKAEMTFKPDGSATGTVTNKDGSKATVTTTKDGETTAKVTVPAKVDSTVVTIPAEKVPAGTVAVIVKDDGTEELVRMSALNAMGVAVKLDGSATVKLVNKAKSFVDVPGHWAEANVDFTSAHELFNGTDATHFTPNGTMTRGMMATVLYRLDGERKGDAKESFADVADGTWYTDAVAWANEAGVVTGYSDTAFGPEDNVTREQLAVMIYRYAKAEGLVSGEKTAELTYADAESVNSWATEAVSWLTANGILIGKPGNLVDPQGNATRAEVSAVLQRFIEFAVR